MIIQTIYTSTIFFIFLCASSFSAQLQLNTQTGKMGDPVTFTVFIHDAPDPVNAFGFEISYDPTCMIYKSTQRGALISNGFQFFRASNVGLGRIRIGGIETGDQIIPKQSDGSLALIQFRVIGEKNVSVRLENLKDDLKTWSTQNGQLILKTQESDNENDSENAENAIDNDGAMTDLSENDDTNRLSASEMVTEQQIQSIPNTSTGFKFPYNPTNDPTQTAVSNRSNPAKPSQGQQTNHVEQPQTARQMTAKRNQKKNQDLDFTPKHANNNLYDNKQLPGEQRFPHTKENQQPYHTNPATETLKKNDWGHMKTMGLSAGGNQNAAISQNHFFKFPAFLSVTLVLSLLVQMGILMMLVLIFRQLSKSERR
jgi:hypothetical protein